MLRIPQPWSKKRGKRRSGHSLSGIAGEAAFYAAVFLIGVFTLSLVLIQNVSPAQSLDVEETLSTHWGRLIFGILSLAAILTGGGGLLFRLTRFGTSSERRSVIAKRGGSIEVSGPGAEPNSRLPYVPAGRSMTDSPGEHLNFRLAEVNPSGGQIAGPAILALLWNSVWFVLLALAVSGFWYGNPRWILTILLVPFAGIGYWAFRFFLTQLQRHAGVGVTIVEIDDSPIFPGEEYRLHVAQCGRLRLRRLKIEVVCEEETFYRQGTDVRVEREQAFSETLLNERDVVVDPQVPWEQQLRFSLPPSVMHSFVGSHNAIRWKIVVIGESRPWPSFCRSFPIVVHPQGLQLPRSPR